jgi:predicted amino acid-binding ACT domain protein
MAGQRLYIVHGRGNDAVGLVGSITAPIGQAGGNIVDLRQDVLHGLFIIDMVVDLSDTPLRINDFTAMIKEISEDTGLVLSVDKYLPVPRSPDKKNILLILLGNDKPGIIACASEMLSKYRANIEAAETIGREGMFLMELLTDVSQCRIPLPNLMASIEKSMSAMGMKTIFQTEDVFNKQKRVVLFDVVSSFMSQSLCSELLQQTDLTAAAVTAAYPSAEVLPVLRKAASCLDGFPVEVMTTVIEGINASSGTMELMQRLKTMGYKIVLVSRALSVVTDYLKGKLDIDYSFGVQTRIDNDSQALVGEMTEEDCKAVEMEDVAPRIAEREGIVPGSITVISDAGLSNAPGIRLEFDLGQLLHLYNEHVISKENLLGLFGSFGVPRT